MRIRIGDDIEHGLILSRSLICTISYGRGLLVRCAVGVDISLNEIGRVAGGTIFAVIVWYALRKIARV